MTPQAPPRRTRAPRIAAGLALVTLVLAGCTDAQKRGYLPGDSDHEVTNQTGRIMRLWDGSWITLIIIGLIVWGFIIWCAIAYRRRKGDTGFPVQVRYHVPLELAATLRRWSSWC